MNYNYADHLRVDGYTFSFNPVGDSYRPDTFAVGEGNDYCQYRNLSIGSDWKTYGMFSQDVCQSVKSVFRGVIKSTEYTLKNGKKITIETADRHQFRVMWKSVVSRASIRPDASAKEEKQSGSTSRAYSTVDDMDSAQTDPYKKLKEHPAYREGSTAFPIGIPARTQYYFRKLGEPDWFQITVNREGGGLQKKGHPFTVDKDSGKITHEGLEFSDLNELLLNICPNAKPVSH